MDDAPGRCAFALDECRNDCFVARSCTAPSLVGGSLGPLVHWILPLHRRHRGAALFPSSLLDVRDLNQLDCERSANVDLSTKTTLLPDGDGTTAPTLTLFV